jgi:hypothetical protein
MQSEKNMPDWTNSQANWEAYLNSLHPHYSLDPSHSQTHSQTQIDPPSEKECDGGSFSSSSGNGEDDSPLGITTKLRTTEKGEENALSLYQLQDIAASLLPHERVAACMRHVVPEHLAEVKYNDDTGKAHYSGIGVCGSTWTCPICASRINAERGRELELGLEHWQLMGGSAILITTTVQHAHGDSLTVLIDTLKSAWRSLKAGRAWSDFKCKYGVMGDVTALEVLHSYKTGWHPHQHTIMLFDHVLTQQEISSIRAFLSERWTYMVGKSGGYASSCYGLDVRGGGDMQSVGKYLSKLGSQWDISREVTGGMFKRSASRSPFQLLEGFNNGSEHDGLLFQEYAEATKGKNQLRYSRGLKAMLLLDEDLTDEDIATSETPEEQEAVTVVSLTSVQFAYVVRVGAREQLLKVTEAVKGSTEMVWEYLKFIGMPVSGAPDREREHAIGRLREVANERSKRGKRD